MRGHRRAVAALVLAAATLTACASAARGRRSLLLRPESPVFSARAPEHYLVRLDTSEGTVVVEVQRDWAPHGADRFYALVHHGFYDGQRFFRVLAGFIAQFGLNGDPAVIAAWKHRTMPDDPVRLSNVRGTLAYAMTGPNTRTTQIFINLADNRRLDAQGFAPFGKVVRGMDVADRLYARYDESAGGGVRGGKQGAIEAGGNEYLERNFPRLDYIKRAVIVAH
jgi:cyclophilin family peptidyl-prolyl cis-trans isomerase